VKCQKCSRTAIAKGLCPRHYQQARRKGGERPPVALVPVRLWLHPNVAKVIKENHERARNWLTSLVSSIMQGK
jgi:hypothetical protein